MFQWGLDRTFSHFLRDLNPQIDLFRDVLAITLSAMHTENPAKTEAKGNEMVSLGDTLKKVQHTSHLDKVLHEKFKYLWGEGGGGGILG